ncbi:MAG: altronate dehydratase family protein [Xanthomonadales bacterium]|nr:altronate dehydratase family protein [Xanthomonadales bacterium]
MASIEEHLIRLHPEDNVALARQLLTTGLNVTGTPLSADIPALHKVALTDIPAGGRIIKYQQTIGIASQAIKAGEHVHSHNCVVASISKDYDFCSVVKPTNYLPESQRSTFQGYRRANGKVGTRNYLGILTSVNCSGTVAHQVANKLNAALSLQPESSIDGAVALVHGTGCGMRSSGDGFDNLQRILRGYALHPNFGGVLLIGLGCEVMQLNSLLQEFGLEQSECLRYLTIQEAGGTRAAVESSLSMLQEMMPKVASYRRETCPSSELTLALQCGGSDALSGITANPALGAAVDRLVSEGGAAILSETPEIYGAEHLLVSRARDRSVAEALIERIEWWERYTRATGDALDNNPSPGNKMGGLTTILEKSLGAVAKGGSTELSDVVRYGELIQRKGLNFMDSPGFDPASVTGQVASGANVICFTTGRGSAFGFKPVPSLKLTTNSQIFQRMNEDMDINCGDILEGTIDVQGKGEEIFQAVLDVASGSKTKSELLDYGSNEFTPWQVGAVV